MIELKLIGVRDDFILPLSTGNKSAIHACHIEQGDGSVTVYTGFKLGVPANHAVIITPLEDLADSCWVMNTAPYVICNGNIDEITLKFVTLLDDAYQHNKRNDGASDGSWCFTPPFPYVKDDAIAYMHLIETKRFHFNELNR